MFVVDRFEPFGTGVFAFYFYSYMREPFVSRSVPVFYAFRYKHDVARAEQSCGLSFFLVDTLARYAKKDLPASFVGAVDMAIIASTRLEGYVEYAVRKLCEITFSDKICGECFPSNEDFLYQ